ncbi:hypothetical protein L208DRAFT_1382089 [Tricholoma matsutake]|nr:hypothetical protein L208DRAFT_1382089 [Tricholoma matsutake 945]
MLEEIWSLLQDQKVQMERLMLMFQQCTAVLSPTQGFLTAIYSQRVGIGMGIEQSGNVLLPSAIIHESGAPLQLDNMGVYWADDSMLHAFSPLLEQDHKLTWYYPQLLHSPSLMHDSQLSLLWLPILGQRSIRWDQVFALVQQPELLWDCWKSSKSLDQYSLEELWTCYSLGEHVFNVARVQTGIKPLLQFVEQYFQSKWHGHSAGDRKKWEHFHEIPEWILLCSTARVVSPMCCGSDNKMKNGLNALVKDVKKLHFANAQPKASDNNLSLESPPLQPLPCSPTPASSLIPPSFPPAASCTELAPLTSLVNIASSGVEKKKRRAVPLDAQRKKMKAA